MNDMLTTSRNAEDPRDEILISRVVDGEATPADWAELDVVAQRDPSIWARLAEAQRAQASLQRAVDDALTVAELVDLPHPSDQLEHTWNRRVRLWGGWLVAAVVAIAWLGNFAQIRALQQNQSGVGAPSDVSQFAGVSSMTPEQLFDLYMQSGKADGRVVGEMPMVMLETVPTSDGRAQITFVRPVIERAIVDRVYGVGQNDAGEMVPVPTSWETLKPGEPL